MSEQVNSATVVTTSAGTEAVGSVIAPPPVPPPASPPSEPPPISSDAQALVDGYKEEAMKNRLKYKAERDERAKQEAEIARLKAQVEKLQKEEGQKEEGQKEETTEEQKSTTMTADEVKLQEERVRVMEERLAAYEERAKQMTLNQSIESLLKGRVIEGSTEFLLHKLKTEGFDGNRIVFDEAENTVKIMSADNLQATNGRGGKLTLAELVDGFIKANPGLQIPAGGHGGAGTEMITANSGAPQSIDQQVNDIMDFRSRHQAWPRVKDENGGWRAKTADEWRSDIKRHLEDYEAEENWRKTNKRDPTMKRNGWPTGTFGK